jgi:DNA invertase Pin-like site-specific DNA recombinase
MAQLKLTKKSVEGLKAPAPSGQQCLFWDTTMPGFGVLVSGTTATKTFVVRGTVGGRGIRKAIERVGLITLDDARLRARQKTDRPALAKALQQLKPGDVLTVTRLDRLARSTRDLLNVLDTVSKAGAGFRSLADEWVNTTTAHGRLLLTILGGLAEFERSLILARTSDGRSRAKAAGVKFGRPPKLSVEQRSLVRERILAGESRAAIARELAVHPTSIGRIATISDVACVVAQASHVMHSTKEDAHETR